MKKLYWAALWATACAALSGCAFGSHAALPTMPGGDVAETLGLTGSGKIKHVVWIVQENRSFNDMFMGFPGARTATSGKNSMGQTVKLQPVSLTTRYEIDHSARGMFNACDGTGKLPGTDCRMDGFNLEEEYGGPSQGQYVYVPHSESKPYWDMAHEFVLADHMHASQLDESFVAHQYIIAAQAQSSVDVPDGAWGCEGGASETVQTITHKRTYGNEPAPVLRLSDARRRARHRPPLVAVLHEQLHAARRRVLVGISGGQAHLQRTRLEEGRHRSAEALLHRRQSGASSQASPGSRRSAPTPTTWTAVAGFGPSWVTSVVNAVGESKFWDSTAVFVQWDDWGGSYDPVPAAVQRLRRPGLPRSAHRDLRLRKGELRLARASTKRRAFYASRRISSTCLNSALPTRARPRRRRLLRFLAEAAQVRPDQSAEGTGLFPAPSQRRANSRRAVTYSSSTGKPDGLW